MKILVTGVAGFIGAAIAKRLLQRGDEVVGIDNLNDYYDVQLKLDRLGTIPKENFRFVKMDICDREACELFFRSEKPQKVVHLAAQAGVRYSIKNPHACVHSNIAGFMNILEGCRHAGVEHLVFASSSSVYGANTQMPFSVHHSTDHPVSLYGATKKANELMAHTYSHLYRIPITGLRFFTVYGPWGRPDMALFLFTRKILAGEPIEIFNHGNHSRDFTYIDDITEGAINVTDRVAAVNASWDGNRPDPGSSSAPYRLYNIGNHRPEKLMRLVEILEECLGRKAEKRFMPMQPGDIPATCADTEDLARDSGFSPSVPVEIGVASFVEWYRSYYRL